MAVITGLGVSNLISNHCADYGLQGLRITRGSILFGKRRITDCGVVAVVVVCIGSSIGSISRSSADYGLQDYGFVGIADCVRISCWHGLQDYGLF